MLNEQINNVMKSALKSASKNTGIDARSVRIQLKLTENLQSAECKIFNDKSEHSDLKWSKLLGLTFIAFKGLVIEKITEGLHRMSDDTNILKNDITAMFRPVSPNFDFEICICQGTTRKKVVQIEELINANS